MAFVEHFPVIIVVISLLSAFTILVVGYFNRKLPCYISIGTVAIQLIMSFFILHHVLTVGIIRYRIGGWCPPWGIEYVVDALNAYFLVIILSLAFLCVIYSKRSIEHEIPNEKLPSFYTIYQLLVTGLCGITVTGDMFNLYVFVEIMSLSAYALIASRGGVALKASFNYLVMGSIGACFYLLGVGFLYAVTGSLNMLDIQRILPLVGYTNKMVHAAFILILVGLSIKMAFFPLHTWLPDAHAFAPSEISAMLSGIIIETSTYAFIRVAFTVFTKDFIATTPFFACIQWLACFAIIYGSVLAIAQFNLKRMLAYSSVSQMGIIMLAVGLSTYTRSEPWCGLTPALMHVLNHALMKACLFLVAGAFIFKYDYWLITELEGIGRKMPLTSAAFTLAALSMIGVPPSVGFASKLYIILACLDIKNFFFAAAILFNALLELVYFWRVIESMYMKGGEHHQSSHAHTLAGASERGEIPLSMLIPVLILAFLCIIVGIMWLIGIPLPILDKVNKMFGLGVVS